jgi:hypothetical protein
VGVRRFAEPAATGWVATVGVPFSGPGTGRAAQSAAAAAREASAVRAKGGLVESVALMRERHERLTSLRASLAELRANGIPAADEALRAIEAGFRSGRFGYLDLQDGHRLRLEQQLLELQQLHEIGLTWWSLARLAVPDPDAVPMIPEVVR